MAFVFAGLLAELGATVAGEVAALTGSEALGTAAGSATTATVAGKIGSAIETGAETGVDYIFGQGTAQTAEEKVSQNFNDAKQTFSGLYDANQSGDYDSYMKNLIAKRKAQAHSNTPSSSGTSIPMKVPESMGTNKMLLPEAENQTFTRPMLVNQDLVRTNGSFIDTIVNASIPSQTQTSTSNFDQVSSNFDTRKTEVTKDPESVGHDLGRLISLHTTEMQTSKKDPIESLKNTALNVPSLGYLIPKVLDFQKNLAVPTTDEYKRIAAVYNGKSIIKESVQQKTLTDGTVMFGAFDEVGNVQLYKVTKKGLKIKPIHGVWVGPNSYNDALPIDLFDTFA